jgi:hypothetical protein
MTTGEVQHYLISIEVVGGHLHTYVMTDDPRVFAPIISEMFTEIERRRWLCPLPIVLQTTLRPEDGVEIVREIIAAGFPEAPMTWKHANRFHRTVFMMPDSGPDASWSCTKRGSE